MRKQPRCPTCGQPGGHPAIGHPLRGTDGKWHFAGTPRFRVGTQPACIGLVRSIAQARARVIAANQARAER